MTSYWHQRDITNRLIAERHERRTQDEAYDAFAEMMDRLPEYLVMAIHDHLEGNELITQTRIEDDF
jgi:hypothetical protein